MKGNKYDLRRILAILLSVLLLASNMGLTVYADDLALEPVDEVWEEAPIIEEGTTDLVTAEMNEGQEQEQVGADADEVRSGITTWVELQAALDQGGTVTLTQNITADPGDGALTVSKGKTVILDLNGFTIDRGLTSAVIDGRVLQNSGTLTIKDSAGGGEITGGWNNEAEPILLDSGKGGGIYNTGTLTLEGGGGYRQ